MITEQKETKNINLNLVLPLSIESVTGLLIGKTLKIKSTALLDALNGTSIELLLVLHCPTVEVEGS